MTVAVYSTVLLHFMHALTFESSSSYQQPYFFPLKLSCLIHITFVCTLGNWLASLSCPWKQYHKKKFMGLPFFTLDGSILWLHSHYSILNGGLRILKLHLIQSLFLIALTSTGLSCMQPYFYFHKCIFLRQSSGYSHTAILVQATVPASVRQQLNRQVIFFNKCFKPCFWIWQLKM